MFGDNWGLRFCALASVGALFILEGIMKKVDKLGRIVIPKELRDKYGFTEGARIEIHDAGEGICVKPYDTLCRICRSRISADTELPLCDECIKKAREQSRKK